MVKYLLGLLIAVLSVSCSSKESERLMQAYMQKQDNYKLLQKTEKLQLKENNETKLLLTVTYLNTPNVDNNDTSDEIFLLGLYSEERVIKSLTDENFTVALKNVMTKKESEVYKKQKLLKEDLRIQVNKKEKEKEKKALYVQPINIQLIANDSPLLKGISFVSDWSQFYLVKFKHMAGNRLTLQIKSKKSEEKTMIEKEQEMLKLKIKRQKAKKIKTYNTHFLYFAKVAKYAL